ncbi:hypothetical protein J7T55_011267 [Diaporthe amygdali]|uniref:uncharacterized protein n=1 Tax=Phomopsis amygdali TaxID=1214568 RepID=UPI0022FEAAEF|nr:uncharacterized protein J7T55_011267 [Diaporthe amygdali]KAJ0108776.1 hypothetical protein J7T55_011267 [Diaporthe amygdali]
MESKPFNDRLWIRLLVLLAYKTATQKHANRLTFTSQPGRVIFISPKCCVKSTPFTRLAEASAMLFVAQHSSVPVPKVYSAFERDGRVYIVMERIDGETIAQGWSHRTDESKAAILEQLRTIVKDLRGIKPPPGVGVASVDGGPIFDHRLPCKSLWGPFPSIQDFHQELRGGIAAEDIQDDASSPGVKHMASFHEQACQAPVFTHGDLSSLNIMVKDDKVVGIVDWETAGWYPPYWEYTSAKHPNPQNSWWQDEVDRFITPEPEALEAEAIRRRFFGDF